LSMSSSVSYRAAPAHVPSLGTNQWALHVQRENNASHERMHHYQTVAASRDSMMSGSLPQHALSSSGSLTCLAPNRSYRQRGTAAFQNSVALANQPRPRILKQKSPAPSRQQPAPDTTGQGTPLRSSSSNLLRVDSKDAQHPRGGVAAAWANNYGRLAPNPITDIHGMGAAARRTAPQLASHASWAARSISRSASAASLRGSGSLSSHASLAREQRLRKMASTAALEADNYFARLHAARSIAEQRKTAAMFKAFKYNEAADSAQQARADPKAERARSNTEAPLPTADDRERAAQTTYTQKAHSASPAARPVDHEAEFERQRLRKEMLSATESSMNSRFTDMFKAFQYIDLDRSGRLSRPEILRALKLWNIPVDGDRMEALMEVCDKDGDGISYEEFCDTLARDTVAPAAQGKRDMQSGAAMGVSAFEQLDLQLGHGVASKHAYSMLSG